MKVTAATPRGVEGYYLEVDLPPGEHSKYQWFFLWSELDNAIAA